MSGLVLSALLLGATPTSGCTLNRAPKAEGAELVVYFTKFETEDTTGGKYKACRIVRKKEKGTKTFFVTPFRQDANVVVHRSNWPKGG